MPAEDARGRNSIEVLEDNLTALIAELGPDLDRVRSFAPRFVSLFTETALSVVVLEHALRKKGIVEPDEMTAALEEAQDAMKRIRGRASVGPAGRA
jgi:hypothetical protein